MPNAKHTPGPWHNSDLGIDVKTSEFQVICRLKNVGDADVQVANARLIAAAPDLLAALEGLLSSPNSNLHHNVARAAIAKATNKEV